MVQEFKLLPGRYQDMSRIHRNTYQDPKNKDQIFLSKSITCIPTLRYQNQIVTFESRANLL